MRRRREAQKAQIESQQEVKRSTKIFILIELTAKLPAKLFLCHESLFGHFSSVIFALCERCKNTPVMSIAQEWSLTWFTSSEKVFLVIIERNSILIHEKWPGNQCHGERERKAKTFMRAR